MSTCETEESGEQGGYIPQAGVSTTLLYLANADTSTAFSIGATSRRIVMKGSQRTTSVG
jgi:hypothetical protein